MLLLTWVVSELVGSVGTNLGGSTTWISPPRSSAVSSWTGVPSARVARPAAPPARRTERGHRSTAAAVAGHPETRARPVAGAPGWG
eukprot:scaffold44961_cov58-Phaeocystis_antarctica.AAC.1